MPISFQWFHKTFNISTNDRMVVFEKDTSKRQIKVV